MPRRPPKKKPLTAPGQGLQSLFVPLAGRQKKLWMSGNYSRVISEVKEKVLEKNPKAKRIQSIRLKFDRGNIQKNVIGISGETWDDYVNFLLPASSNQWIKGFQIRLVVPLSRSKEKSLPIARARPYRDKSGRFAKKPASRKKLPFRDERGRFSKNPF